MSIRTIIADDEPLARERIRDLLKRQRDIEVIAECSSGSKTVSAIEQHRPDLLFLDVQMPELDGFGVLESVGPRKVPAIIFVTAYDKYALKAFDAHAVDYLLKPFDEKRFKRALERAREHIQRPNGFGEHLRELLNDVKSEQKEGDRLVVKSSGRVLFLRTQEIDYIEAAGNYLTLHVGKDTHLLRETMNNMEARLDPRKFMRIHRSSIVNIERIKELQPWFGGEYVVVLRDGQQLTLSRTYRSKLQELLGD
jgi:two-component system LytT family response regulator